MPKGPKGQMRPADANACAVMVAKIATGELTETLSDPAGRSKSGQAGAKARAGILTPAERSRIAQKAGRARWKT
jgi:hypothetical protein